MLHENVRRSSSDAATEVVGQIEGQHRNDLVHCVDRGCALVRFDVDGRVFLYIMRDIRDMHAETIDIVADLFNRYGVVEVLRAVAVNREDGLIAQIEAAFQIVVRDFFYDRIRFVGHFGGEGDRNVVFLKY